MTRIAGLFYGNQQGDRVRTDPNRIIQSFLLILYVALNFYFITCHINWRDEAQSWMLARDLSLVQLIKQMSYEGHPCLWHLLLFPFAKLGFPYESMNIVSLLLMSVAAAIFLWKSPFPILVKGIVLFSNSFVFFLPVVSRSYSLIPSIMCLLAVYYPRRHEKALMYGFLIALLVQTHIIMLGMAAALSFFWFGESILTYCRNKEGKWLIKQAAGLTLPLISLLLLLFQLVDVSSSSAFHVEKMQIATFVYLFMKSVAGIQIEIPAELNTVVICVVTAFLLLLILYMLCRKQVEGMKLICISLFAVIFQISIYTLMYSSSSQRYITIHFIGLWLFWVVYDLIPLVKIRRIVLCATCAFFAAGWMFYFTNYQMITGAIPYSDSYSCAQYIQEHIPEGEIIIVTSEPHASAVLPYCDRDSFYSIKSGEMFSFVTWQDRENAIQTSDDLYAWAKERFPDKKELYLLDSDPFSSDYINHLLLENSKLVYETKSAVSVDEIYKLYCVPLS